jgi:pimeloyl-ACP methyl ester carboxylesterase
VLEPVIWISPDTDPVSRSPGRFAAQLAPHVRVEVVELRVWHLEPGAPYDSGVEVSAITDLVDVRGFDRFHLFGFSAGGTIALAAALALGERVISLTTLEPATIGADEWDPVEAEWQAEMRRSLTLPVAERGAAFRRALMKPGLAPPPETRPFDITPQDEMLEQMIFAPGFQSTDLSRLTEPVLTVIGGQSSPRWQLVAERLEHLLPNARTEVFAELSHFTPPHREAPEAFERLLVRFWGESESQEHS